MAHRKVPNAKQQPYSRPCKSTVPQSQTILAQQQEDDSIYAALKAICENLGIDYSSQLKKLKVHKWAVVVIIPTTGTDGKTYRMTVIDRKALAMWLATLNPSHISNPLVRQKVELYQAEAAEALDAYFNEGGAIRIHEDDTDMDITARAVMIAQKHMAQRDRELESFYLC